MNNNSFISPFQNDPFALVAIAFRNLYPDKEYTAGYDPEIKDDAGEKVYGITSFQKYGSVCVIVNPSLKVTDAIEVFAHELAHVATGEGHEHDEEWQHAFDRIFEEYERIGNELFSEKS